MRGSTLRIGRKGPTQIMKVSKQISFTLELTAQADVSACFVNSIAEVCKELTIEESQQIKTAFEHGMAELGRQIEVKRTEAIRAEINAMKAKNGVHRELRNQKWIDKEKKKEARSPRGKADAILRSLTGGKIDLSQFAMMTKVWCPKHETTVNVCGCGKG
jgi:hypothetical protein